MEEQVRVIAAVRQNFNGRWVLRGEPITMGRGEAEDLVAMNFARWPKPGEAGPEAPAAPALEPEVRQHHHGRRGRRA